MHPTDDELIEAYLRGSEGAFSALVERHLSPVYSFALRLVGTKEDAEDITQETFLKAWKNLNRFRKGANVKTWLFAIARNSAIDYLRKKRPLLFGEFQKNESDDDFEHAIADSAPHAEALFDASILGERLDIALQKLPPLYREVLLLHYMESLTLEEVADVLNVPVNTVKSRDRRALARLRAILEPEPS